ncbi:hydrogenase maturation protease [Neptuniibacter sp. QD34_54]|uniref:hydrogenase maturation protease n=1 Tax=unclassified Neptuniibacter TaxID=2630693 RepID=UPI0039F650A1
MTVILCFGNEWHGDDGFGYAVYNTLNQTDLPSKVDLYYCATNSLTATRLIKDTSRLILVDAYQSDSNNAGTLQWFSKDEFQTSYARNLHDGGLEELIKHCDILFDSQELVIEILTVTIHQVSSFSEKLSPIIENCVSEACNQILTRVNQEPHYVYS